MEKATSPYSSFPADLGYNSVTMIPAGKGKVIRNLSMAVVKLISDRVPVEIGGEKARVEGFLLVITVEHRALEGNREGHGGVKQIEK